jgi:hypothetical protein
MKYWTLEEHGGGMRLDVGRMPWVSVAVVELILGTMGTGILFVLHRQAPQERGLLLAMTFGLAAVLIANGVLPWCKVRKERRFGAMMVYHPDRQKLELPRERLSLARSQVLEFQVLYEKRRARRLGIPGWIISGKNGPAELRVVYRNPSEKMASLLRVDDAALLDEVTEALVRLGIAPVVRREVLSGLSERKSAAVR